MIDPEEIRQTFPDKNLTDEQVGRVGDEMHQLADLLLDIYEDKLKSRDDKK